MSVHRLPKSKVKSKSKVYVITVRNHINKCNSNRVKDYNTLLLLHRLENEQAET